MTPTPAPPAWRAWYAAARPRTLTATYVPLAVAGAAALTTSPTFNVAFFALALTGALLLQVGANLVNEYADHARGADALKVAGQGMTIKQNVLTPRQVLLGAVVSILGGALIGLYLLFQTGPLLLWIGLGGVLVAITYTAGPFPLAYNGLGEVAAGVFMGPLMTLGAYYATTGRAAPVAVLAGLPIALMVAAILHANNIRDMDADRAVRKRTLAVLLGLRAARIEYKVLVYGAYVVLVVLILAGWFPPFTLLALITLPQARRLVRAIDTETDPQALHAVQGRTALLHGRFGLWIAVGWLLWGLVLPLMV